MYRIPFLSLLPCRNLTALPKARSNANYIFVNHGVQAAASKVRVVIPLELPAHKSWPSLGGPDGWTVAVCTEFMWKCILGKGILKEMGFPRAHLRELTNKC